MKKHILFSLLLIASLFVFQACTSDGSGSGDGENAEGSVMDADDIINAITETDNTATMDSSSITGGDEIQTPELTEEEKEKEKQHAEERKKIVQEQMEKSVNKGKGCDEVYKDYETLVNNILKDGFAKHLDELTKWNNDPLFNACKKKDSHKAKFDALIEKLNADDEEEE